MQLFYEYIIANWQWLLPIFVTVVEFFILLIFKKAPITNIIDTFYGEIVSFIREAENVFGAGRGDEKKKYVMGLFLSSHPTFPVNQVSRAIEDILSTPQRKEGING